MPPLVSPNIPNVNISPGPPLFLKYVRSMKNAKKKRTRLPLWPACTVFSSCGESFEDSKFSIEKCLQRVMNSCALVFRQHHHCKNNRLTTGRPQDTARRKRRPLRHSSAKHVKGYSKIKKLGCYCFCKSWFRPICPFHRSPPGRCPDVVE